MFLFSLLLHNIFFFFFFHFSGLEMGRGISQPPHLCQLLAPMFKSIESLLRGYYYSCKGRTYAVIENVVMAKMRPDLLTLCKITFRCLRFSTLLLT